MESSLVKSVINPVPVVRDIVDIITDINKRKC